MLVIVLGVQFELCVGLTPVCVVVVVVNLWLSAVCWSDLSVLLCLQGSTDQLPLEVDLLLSDGSSISDMLLDIGVLVKENDMEEFYQRSIDITNILNVSISCLL